VDPRGNVRLLREVTPETVARLQAEFGQDLSVGGADLAASFMRLGLIDEYGLFVQPIRCPSVAAFELDPFSAHRCRLPILEQVWTTLRT
jgi:riboflavin biosynthesis pyrimidine reductase